MTRTSMRIVMLGHSNAGKTTYMSAMYAVARTGVQGFQIRTKDGMQDAELLSHAKGIRCGNYPPPSARRVTYEFVVSYEGEEFFDFTWSDYRGGALLDRTSSEETTAVLADLRSADGIVVCVDAHALSVAADPLRPMRRLTVLLQRVFDDRARAKPIVVAYTKADLVQQDDPAEWSRIRLPLASIVTAANASGQVLATEVGVSCGVGPRNVEVPLLWCLGNGVRKVVADLEAEEAAFRKKAKKARAKASFPNEISSWITGSKSHSKKAEEARRRAKKRWAELRPLREPAEHLTAMLVGRDFHAC